MSLQFSKKTNPTWGLMKARATANLNNSITIHLSPVLQTSAIVGNIFPLTYKLYTTIGESKIVSLPVVQFVSFHPVVQMQLYEPFVLVQLPPF